MGTKLREKDITGSSTQTNYCGNVIYENGKPTILFVVLFITLMI
jgi:hypothetical protein